ncbi:MAG TPA: YraN family protein [Candidatus Andersenbacteria bacterium]|nr:YraN family protein [Candidatus Andersenbacteria bacterium]
MGFTIIKGSHGENIAKEFLEHLGLQFLQANWRCKMGEVDLIFQDKDERVFVEVRSRKETTFGEGLETVFFQKQKKLIKTAKYYQQKERYWGNIRFDVVSIVLTNDIAPTITHIPHAFMEEL